MSFDPVQILSERFAKAIAAVVPGANVDPQITAGRNPKFGDFQCNAAMALGKAAGKPPREVAAALVKAVDVSDIAEPLTDASIAGPGFINIMLRADVLARLLSALDQPGLGVDTSAGGGRTVVVDLCGVNLAKQMHVGHLRSTIIGDSLARVMERLGWNVLRQNHVGDWGLPIAMVTSKLAALEAGGQDIGALTLDQLEKLYKAAQKECDADERGLAAAKKFYSGPKALAELEEQVGGASEAMAKAKQTLLKLQAHDPATMALWQRIVDITMTECLKTCARLNTIIAAEHSAGESSYATELAGLVADLEARGVATADGGRHAVGIPGCVEKPVGGPGTDQGALVVWVEGIQEPCIVRKSDGGFLYATTDLAAIRRRVQKFGASRVVYCVDARQSLHFRQVFGAAIKAGYATIKDRTTGAESVASLEHAAFGSVLGDDGRPLKTRSGENVKLADLIDEAIARAERVVGEKNPDLSPLERSSVAEAVGIAAIKYADLSSDRVKDYVFNFDRMLAFEGDTGPYLLYALVRVRRIFKEAQERGVTVDPHAPIVIAQPEEKQLALTLLKYPQALRSVGASLEPHRLCQYLFELAQTYSTFYDKCHVLKAPDEPTRQSRLHLCRLVERIMADGLTLLGVKLLDRM